MMDLRSKGFGIEAEISIKASSMGLSIKDIPIAYGERIGEAKLHGLKDGYRIACTIAKHFPYLRYRFHLGGNSIKQKNINGVSI
jgi:hypothetical protein